MYIQFKAKVTHDPKESNDMFYTVCLVDKKFDHKNYFIA